MKPKAYVETTVIGYLTSRPSRDVVTAAHQKLTREWWDSYSRRFELVASELVVQEASAGNQAAARDRLEILASLTLLEVTESALELTRELLRLGAVPKKFVEDALHIAIAAVSGIEYLVTWNCRHIANATMRGRIEDVCRLSGLEPPTICTPEELLGFTDDDAT